MIAKELRIKNHDELMTELESLLKTHLTLRLQAASQQLTKTSELRQVRRSIARVRTILREKVI